MAKDFGLFSQGWSRGLIISILILPILIRRKELIAIKREDLKWILIFCLATALTQAPLYFAFNHLTIGAAHLIFYVSMLIAMWAWGVLGFGEKANKLKILSLIFAMLGLVLLTGANFTGATLVAVGMAVLNGAASGSELSSSKKLSANYSALYLSLISWLAILIGNLPFSLLLGESLPSLGNSTAWLWQLAYSLVSLLGFWLAMLGLKYLESSVGGLILLLELVFAVFYGVFLFGEPVTIQIVAGGVLILLAGALPSVGTCFTKAEGG
jgi:drug/metabolite transporter (DMT)-like permease